MRLISPEMGLTCWRIRRFWRFLSNWLHHESLGGADDFDEFYSNPSKQNQLCRIGVKEKCHFFSFVNFKPWLSIGVFLLLCLASSVHDELTAHNAKCISLERENSCPFSYCRKKPDAWGYTRTNKSKLQYKVPSKLPFRRAQFVSPTVRFTLYDFIFTSPLFKFTIYCIMFFVFSPTSPLPSLF